VGSLYYLAHATEFGLPDGLARSLADLVVWTVALSVVVHGVSVTPIMDRYGDWAERRKGRGVAPSAPPL
jgi:NhaP-type Na+/H+ or K+/H+ antiporter